MLSFLYPGWQSLLLALTHHYGGRGEILQRKLKGNLKANPTARIAC
jgi:hypothetical protein